VNEPRDAGGSGARQARGTAGPALAPDDDRVHDDRMREALKVAAVEAEETGGLGRLGRPVNKRGIAGRRLPVPAVVLALLCHRLRRRGIPAGHLLARIAAEGTSADGPP